jgi:hypothetical protein
VCCRFSSFLERALQDMFALATSQATKASKQGEGEEPKAKL